jgi:hypothetical protein
MTVEFIVLAIFVPLVVGLLTNELSDLLPVWAEKIVVRTARELPEYVQNRYIQDWLADLEDHPTGFSKLKFAFSLRFGVQLLREEHGRFIEVEYRQQKAFSPRIISVVFENELTENAKLLDQNYLIRARRRFLEGTNLETPAEAVEKGVRSVELWQKILEEERLRRKT